LPNFPVQNIAQKEGECLTVLYQHISQIAYFLVLLCSDLLPGETMYDLLKEEKDVFYKLDTRLSKHDACWLYSLVFSPQLPCQTFAGETDVIVKLMVGV